MKRARRTSVEVMHDERDEMIDKSSAVAEMGDRGHNRHEPKRKGAAVPLSRGGAGSPSNTMWPGRGLLPYQVASSSIQPFGHKRHGPKIGGCAPLGERKLGPHQSQCRLGRGLPPYKVVYWCIQPFGHNRHERKIGEGCVPFLERGAGSPSNTMWPRPRLCSYQVAS